MGAIADAVSKLGLFKPVDKAKPDSDGVPPGMSIADIGLIGKSVEIEFSGKFFALGGANVKFRRNAKIFYVLKKTLIAIDSRNNNVYVIERETGISQGCLMKAKVFFKGRDVV